MRVWRTAPEIAEITIPDGAAVTRFLEWVMRDDNGQVTDLIWEWCLIPAEFGGLGALPEDMNEVIRLHTGVGERLATLLATGTGSSDRQK